MTIALSSPVVRRLVHEGRAPRERRLDPDVLAEHVARGLDAVGRHVEHRAAAGELGIPEVRGMRPGVRLAGTERDRPTDGTRLDHLAHPHQLGTEDDVLEVAAPDAGRCHGPEHLRGLVRGSGEWLGAHDALAVAGGRRHGLHVEVVRQRDDDQIDVLVGAHGVDGVVGVRVAQLFGEPAAARLVAAVAGGQSDVAHVAQAPGVELADEAGAEHADADRAAGHAHSVTGSIRFRRPPRGSTRCLVV